MSSKRVLQAATMVFAVALLGAGPSVADEPLGPFSGWSPPVNLGPPVNTVFEESAPTVSADGLELYFNRNPNGLDPSQPGKVDEDLYVSHRDARDEAWGEPAPLEVVNTPTFHERNATLSRDGSLLFFSSNRAPGGFGGLDLYVSRRLGSAGGWSPPVNLGGLVNSASDDVGPAYVEDEAGSAVLYLTSNRAGGLGGFDIYVSAMADDGSFGMPLLVRELSSASNDARPAVRGDGLEVVFQSNRLPSAGLADLWVSTRETTAEPWGAPVNLGAAVNTAFNDRQPALTGDAEGLFLASNRPGFGSDDIWLSTRKPPAGLIVDLIDHTLAALDRPVLPLPLKAELEGALTSVLHGYEPAACLALRLYELGVGAASGTAITPLEAQALIEESRQIRLLLGCP